jgi:hypothetical protein
MRVLAVLLLVLAAPGLARPSPADLDGDGKLNG